MMNTEKTQESVSITRCDIISVLKDRCLELLQFDSPSAAAALAQLSKLVLEETGVKYTSIRIELLNALKMRILSKETSLAVLPDIARLVLEMERPRG